MRAAVTGDLRKLPYKELQNFLFWWSNKREWDEHDI
jgi:hypothetical protein